MFINKNIVSCLTAVAVAASLLFTSCLKIDDGQESAYGYLTIEGFDLDVVVEPLLPTKGETVALAEVYGYDSENHKPVLTTVTVKPENGSSISYELDGNALKLPVGKYTLSAVSGTNGFGEPYFVGEVEVEIKSMKQTTASIVFSLGNSVLKVVNDMPDHFIPVGESPVKISSSTGSVQTALDTYVFVPSQEELTIQVEGKSSAEVSNPFETIVSATTAKTAYEVVITAGDALPSFTLPEQSNGAWGGRLYINPVTSVTGISSDNLAKIVYEVYSDAACETRISSSAEGGTVVDGLQNGSQYYVRAKVGNLYSENTVGPVTVMAPMVTNAHYNDSDGNLAGTNSTLDLKLNNFLNERISIGEITLDKGNYQVRSTPASGQNILSVSEGWPYLPAGTDYTLKVQHKLKTESESEYKTSTIESVEVPAPEFEVVSDAYTSYSLYSAGNVSGANDCDAGTIYDLLSVTPKIASGLLTNTKYGEESQSVTLDGEIPTADDVSGQTWTKHTIMAEYTFAGTTRSVQKEVHITGLPYNMQENTCTDRWELSGGTAEWDDKTIYLDHAENNSATLTFHSPSTIDLNLVTSLSLYTPTRLARPSVEIIAGGQSLGTYTGDSGTAKTTNFSDKSHDGSIKSDNASIKYSRSYKYSREGNAKIQKLIVKYR